MQVCESSCPQDVECPLPPWEEVAEGGQPGLPVVVAPHGVVKTNPAVHQLWLAQHCAVDKQRPQV